MQEDRAAYSAILPWQAIMESVATSEKQGHRRDQAEIGG
jgi:hypothetical protein